MGSFLTDSGTAEGEVQALDERMFVRYRKWIDLWLEVHLEMFGPEAPHPNIPDSAGFDWDRLREGAATVSDACNQAQAMNQVIKRTIKEKYIEKIGADVWAQLSQEEQDDAVRVHEIYCQNHLRNSCARRSVKYEEILLKDKFAATIEAIPSHLRVKGSVSELLRAIPKEFMYCSKNVYAKGFPPRSTRCPTALSPSRTRPAVGAR